MRRCRSQGCPARSHRTQDCRTRRCGSRGWRMRGHPARSHRTQDCRTRRCGSRGWRMRGHPVRSHRTQDCRTRRCGSRGWRMRGHPVRSRPRGPLPRPSTTDQPRPPATPPRRCGRSRRTPPRQRGLHRPELRRRGLRRRGPARLPAPEGRPAAGGSLRAAPAGWACPVRCAAHGAGHRCGRCCHAVRHDAADPPCRPPGPAPPGAGGQGSGADHHRWHQPRHPGLPCRRPPGPAGRPGPTAAAAPRRPAPVPGCAATPRPEGNRRSRARRRRRRRRAALPGRTARHTHGGRGGRRATLPPWHRPRTPRGGAPTAPLLSNRRSWTPVAWDLPTGHALRASAPRRAPARPQPAVRG